MSEPVGDGLPPWLVPALREALARHRGHALLVQADAGAGALEFALALAGAWLCEAAAGPRPCGRCAGCQLLAAHTHPDLRVNLPQVTALRLGFPVELRDGRKPSRQIRIDEIRDTLAWSATTAARTHGKVVVLHPAEAMNDTAASALLKTLEEPADGVRLILTTADPALLLPTVVSRCQRMVLGLPPRAQALQWLQAQGVADAAVLLDAAAGRPLTARDWARDGLTAGQWAQLPMAVARGDASPLAGWPVPRMLDALHKLGHDSAAAHFGAGPRFYPVGSVPAPRSLPALNRWHRRLLQVMHDAEHPWQEGLLLDALVGEAAEAWASPPAGRPHAGTPA